VFKKFILGSLLVAGLTACPIEPIVPPQPASPKAVADLQSINPNTATSTTILPADNDIFDSSASRVLSSIDLDASKSGQQLSYNDSTGKGTFSLNTSTGVVTFKPTAGKTGIALATYTIKDTNGNVSNPAKIEVTISTIVQTGPIRVLFIGNSRTIYPPCPGTPNPSGPEYNIPQTLKSMAVNETRKLEVTSITICGSTLQQHWNNGNFPGTARGEISRRAYDYVILQAKTDETGTVNALQGIVSQFNTEVIAAGAKTILYENWWKSGFSNQTTVTPIFKSVASALGIYMAPVGQGWKLSGLTDAQLFNNDGDLVHALPNGAYSAASTFFWMFYKKAPSTTTGVPTGVTDPIAARAGAQSAYSVLESNFRLP
jgi:hypothetical protein